MQSQCRYQRPSARCSTNICGWKTYTSALSKSIHLSILLLLLLILFSFVFVWVPKSADAKLRHASTNLRIRSIATTCRAVVLPRFGGPEVLEVRHDVEIPDLKPRELLVRTRAVSINPLDTRMRSGYGRSIFEPLLPLILGRDISGEVAAIGASVRSFSVGEEVFGALHPTAVRGTYADYAILSEEELAAKPSSMTHVEASAIPFAALTAWRALKTTARIAEGDADELARRFSIVYECRGSGL